MFPSVSTNTASAPSIFWINAVPFSIPNARQLVESASPSTECPLSAIIVTESTSVSAGNPVLLSRMW